MSVAQEVALDTETTGLHVNDGRDFTMGASSAFDVPGYGRLAHYMPFRHEAGNNLGPEYREKFKDVLSFRVEHKLPVVFHNAKFDLTAVETLLGIDLWDLNYYDTMLMAHFIREERPFTKSLDAVAKHYLDDPGKKATPEFKKFTEKLGWGAVPSDSMYEYAAYDADLTLRVFRKLWPLWVKEGLDDWWQTHKRELLQIIRTMENRGVKVDQELCREQIHIGEWAMQDSVEILGLNPGSTNDLAKLFISQLGLPVVKTTPGGRASFDKEAMEIYDQILERSTDPTAQVVLQYRGWQKATSASYKAYLDLLSPDGRLRPNYKLHGTKTGRLSCEKPNLQQIPRISTKPWNAHTKQAFIEDEGWELYEADYSQLELRLATAYAQEPSLMEVFNEGRDIFTEMAEGLGLVRQDTKTFVYSTQYGAGKKRLMHVFGWTEEEADYYRNRYRSSFPRFTGVSDMAQRFARVNGYARLWSGRCRHFEFPKEHAHKAFNAVIQGGAADVVEYTIRRLFNEVDDPASVRMLLQVHDSVVFAIRQDVVNDVLPKIKSIMEDVYAGKFTGLVKFAVDVHKWGH